MGLFAKLFQRNGRKNSVQTEKKQLLAENLIKFPYLEALDGVLTYDKRGIVCDCCLKRVKLYSEMGIYSEATGAELLCADCIASGAAAEKFDGTFQSYLDEDGVSPENYDAVMRRTPTIPAYQDFEWKICCGKPCVYMRRATKGDFPAILEQLKETYSEEEEGVPFDRLSELGGESDDTSNLMLFRCKECGKIYGVVDLD